MINLHTGFRYGVFFREKTTTIIEFLSFSLSGAYKPEGLEERSPDAIASHVVSIKLTYQNSLVHGGTWAFMGVCVGRCTQMDTVMDRVRVPTHHELKKSYFYSA